MRPVWVGVTFTVFSDSFFGVFSGVFSGTERAGSALRDRDADRAGCCCKTTKEEQAVRHNSLDLSVPMPTTSTPAVRSRTERAEKSLSLEAMMTTSVPPTD